MKSQLKLTFLWTLLLLLLFLVFWADGEKTPTPTSSTAASNTTSTPTSTASTTSTRAATTLKEPETTALPVTTPENSWLLMCDMLHPGKFVFDASVADHGCSLRCIYLDSSHNTSNEYYDVSIQKDHNLNDGIYCRRDHVCKAGNCTLETDINSLHKSGHGMASHSIQKKGIIVVEVLNGKVPQKDTFSPSDTYVKLFISKSPINNSTNSSNAEEGKDVKFGTTKVAWDTNEPSFYQTFKIEKVAISSTVMLLVYEKDLMNQDDYIASVYVAVKTLLSTGKNHQPQTLFFPPDDKYYINCTISWISYE